jgi:hypothetical protein
MNMALENFQKNTADFLEALALFPDRGRTIAPDGEWSAAFIVHHVADGELHFAARYLHTLGSDNPTMIYFEEERYPAALHYDQRSIAKSLASIAGIRAMVFEVLSTVDESAWSRTTTSQDGAVFTLAQLIEKANSHLVSHTQQLKELRAKYLTM